MVYIVGNLGKGFSCVINLETAGFVKNIERIDLHIP